MKTLKIESRITYFILTLALFLLNFHKFNLLAILFGSILALLSILFFEKVNLTKFKFWKIFLISISFLFTIFYLNKITYFIGDNILRDYSTITISLTLLLTIFLLANKGYHTIIKVIILSSYFLILGIILGFATNILYINMDNLNLTIFNFNNLIAESISYSLIFIYSYFLVYPISNTKFKKLDLIIPLVYQIFLYLIIISILGTTLTNLYIYPYITIFKKVSLIDFIERIEIIFAIFYLFYFYFLLLLAFFQIKSNLEFLIKKDKPLKLTLIFLTILIFFFSIATF